MRSTKEIIIANKFFLAPYFLLLLTTAPLFFFFDKHTIHLFLNQYNSRFFDGFFKIVTNLGDGSMPFIIGAVLCLFSFRKAIIVAGGGTLAGLLAQFMKRIVFPEIQRPSAALVNHESLYLVPDVHLHSSFSFPSGHAATALAIVFCLAVLTKKEAFKLILFCIGIIIAYSRVYISQHFLVDIWFGSLLGVTVALLFARVMLKIESTWMDISILKLIKRKKLNV